MTFPTGFEDRTQRDAPLADRTTIRIGGTARYLVMPRDRNDAAAVLAALKSAGVRALFLGGGSNLLIGDGRLDAAVVHPVHLNHIEFNGTSVSVGAGVGLSELIAKTTDRGLAGLERLAGIPGQIGGAVAMNAGGRYGWMSDFVESVDLILGDGTQLTASGADLRFGYREADLPPGALVAATTLRLKAGDRKELKREAGRILKEKNAAQPTTGWNFGCIFKNPEGVSAGKLVEAAGLKGRSVGGARISPLHGNFVENLGGARARDVLELVELAEAAVAAGGVQLLREVRVWITT